MRKTKVFAIGFHRTGTTSIARALEMLGYRFTGPNFTFEENLPETVHELAFNLALQYDAFSDSPWFLLYRELDEKFPGSKFILTVRPAEAWLRSARKLAARPPMQRYIYGECIADASDALLLERYERHNREVQEYFVDRPDDLLVIDLSAGVGWPQFCRFLGTATPEAPFPHLNRSARSRLSRTVHRMLPAKVNSIQYLATQSYPPPAPHPDGNSGRNVLLLSMSAGAGCVRAAEAVAAALRQLAPSWQVRHDDALRLPGAIRLRTAVDESYRRIERNPGLWDQPGNQPGGPPLPGLLSSVRQALRWRWNSLRREYRLRPLLPALVEIFRERPWDAIICTSPNLSKRLSAMKVSGALSAPLFVINTDFMAHPTILVPRCDHVFASCEDSAADLEALGWLPHKMTVTGIPVMPEFARPQDRQACRERFGLHQDKPVVVLLSGGFGMESTAVTLQHLAKTRTPLQILVCTGRNQDLRRQLESASVPARHDVKILGWTDGIEQLLTAADLVLTKPGGLTSAEILSVGAAMAIINPMADHERQNRNYLMEGGAAVNIEHVHLIPRRIERLLARPDRLVELRSNARRLARPEAAFDIGRFLLDWFGCGVECDPGSADGADRRSAAD